MTLTDHFSIFGSSWIPCIFKWKPFTLLKISTGLGGFVVPNGQPLNCHCCPWAKTATTRSQSCGNILAILSIILNCWFLPSSFLCIIISQSLGAFWFCRLFFLSSFDTNFNSCKMSKAFSMVIKDEVAILGIIMIGDLRDFCWFMLGLSLVSMMFVFCWVNCVDLVIFCVEETLRPSVLPFVLSKLGVVALGLGVREMFPSYGWYVSLVSIPKPPVSSLAP